MAAGAYGNLINGENSWDVSPPTPQGDNVVAAALLRP